jgi:uncharacterized repeat protein (TIGR01451 family)
MKNILLKLICVFTLIFGTANVSKAQLVHIPDSAFRAYLNGNFASCMVGNFIDATCPEVLNAKNITLAYSGISNLSGIHVFVNDTALDCSNNLLTALPQLPASLTNLYCSYNQLTALPTLPLSLKVLECYENLINQLPTLPDSLTKFRCDKNLLTTLPVLPSALKELYCGLNPITSLPALPPSLNLLYVYSCPQITALPTLPLTLQFLVCQANSLTSLPALPPSLYQLSCTSNQLTSLPALPSSLSNLSCKNNQLTTLPALPNSLTQLFCSHNQLNILPTLPLSLKRLECNDNQLTLLPSLPLGISILYCESNKLTSLPILPASLIQLRCTKNKLTSLPNLPDSLKQLLCSYNLITSLPILPDSLSSLFCTDNPLTCLPYLNNVTSLYFSNTLVNCLPNYGIVTTSIPDVDTMSICDLFNSNGCDVFWNIEGSTFFDADTNCNLGTNELLFKNQKLNLYKNGVLDQQTFSNLNGDYDFDTFSFDLYKTEFDTTGVPFEVHCPLSGFYLDSISVLDSMKYDRDFGLKCKDVDLGVTSIFSNNLRPASIREIKIECGDYSNYFGAHCAAGISGIVNITITGACNYFSPAIGALTPNTIVGNVLTYYVPDFGVLSYDSSFNFNILVDTAAILGSPICIQVSICTPATESNYNNNLFSHCFTVVGSFDPNDKSVYPTSNVDISSDRWLTYTIRFQNTGTADAEHIFITDTLSSSLDLSTFSLLSYSHQPLTQVYNDGLLKFSFPNIHLPDSNTNEPASHGFVQYKIRAKDSLSIGSTIENTANIFFDFNAPVITNTTSNTIINCAIPPTYVSTTICQGEVFILNSAVYLSPGTFYQILKTSQGCDSTVILNITMLPRSEYHISDSICDGTSINFNGQILSTAGVFTDTLVNSIGCDSIIYFNLSILAKSTNQLTEQICAGDTFNFNGQLLSLPGQYSDTLLNSIGCDSIVNLGLSIIPTFTSQNAAICNGSIYAFGGQILTSAGIYTDSLLNILGCDSIINLTLQINPSYFSQQSITTCDFEPYLFDGNILTQSGTYYDSLQTINGCDSIIELQLNITGLTNIITQTSNIIQTQAIGSAYQWIDCATNTAIVGATNSTYQPNQTGDYSVAVTYGTCIDTSSCFSFSMVGLPSSIGADVIFQTRYNSNSDNIQLHAEKLKGNKGVLRLMDISGRIIFQKEIENIAAGNLDIEIPAKGMNAGIYLVNLITERDNISGKVVKY